MKKVFASLLLVLATSFIVAEEGANWFADKFPETLINKSGKKVNTANALKGKKVALYFSASWCGPCRGFTPSLVKFYKANAQKAKLELVFVSSDKSEKDMLNYMKKDAMPWLAIPFDNSAIASLKSEFSVNSIPRLVILDANGKVLSENARFDVQILGNKAVAEWQKPDYKPLTYDDYIKNSNSKNSAKNKKSKKSKKRR